MRWPRPGVGPRYRGNVSARCREHFCFKLTSTNRTCSSSSDFAATLAGMAGRGPLPGEGEDAIGFGVEVRARRAGGGGLKN